MCRFPIYFIVSYQFNRRIQIAKYLNNNTSSTCKQHLQNEDKNQQDETNLFEKFYGQVTLLLWIWEFIKSCLNARDLLGVEQEGRLSTNTHKKLKVNNHFYSVEAITKDERKLKITYHREWCLQTASKNSFKFDKSFSIAINWLEVQGNLRLYVEIKIRIISRLNCQKIALSKILPKWPRNWTFSASRSPIFVRPSLDAMRSSQNRLRSDWERVWYTSDIHRGQTSEAVFVFLFREKSFTLTWKHQ